VEVSPVDVRDAPEIEHAVTAFARSGNGGLIVTSSALASRYRDLIITLAARHKLPAVYGGRWFVTAGGLLSYGPDYVDQFRQAAGYVDRILKGEKPADLPVQSATKYELAINLKTAKTLGLTVLRCMSPSLRLEITRLFFKLGASGRMTGQRDAVDFQTAGTVAQI
jgi:putative ABC transport system substrate-binding protein